MKKLKVLTAILCIFLLNACQEGPAEKKGKQLDNKIQKVKDKIENKGPAQKAGEKIDEVTGD